MAHAVSKEFWNETRERLGRLPVWFPGTPMALGDIGTLSEQGWTKVGTLAGEGIQFSVSPTGAPTNVQFQSHSGVDVAAHATGATNTPLQGIASGNAGIQFSFNRGEAFVFQSTGMQVSGIEDLGQVEEQILLRYRERQWRKEWVVVTEVTTGSQNIILVAQNAGASITIDLGADVPAAASSVTAGAKVVCNSGMAASFITASPCTVLWRGSYVRDRWFERPTTKSYDKSLGATSGLRLESSEPARPGLSEIKEFTDVPEG